MTPRKNTAVKNNTKRSFLPYLFAGYALWVLTAIIFTNYSHAATTSTQTMTATATVNAYIETSLNSTSLNFGSIDPNTNDTSGGAFLFASTSNSNTAIDIYLNATNLTYSSYSIDSSNIRVSTGSVPIAGKAFNGSTWINGTSANTGFYEGLAAGSSTTFKFWLNVPAAQAAGGYSGTVNIKAVADGNTP